MQINRLQIFTSRFKEQLEFYSKTLGLPVEIISEENFEVILGYSRLEFLKKTDATPYHLAFHIPDKQENLALEWLAGRVEILRNNSEEIVDFPAWNAKSIYFYDEDSNILEFISRRDFNPPSSGIFSEESILGISEVGIGTKDVREKFNFLNSRCGLEKYDGDFERFCAIGNDRGLLITINREEKDWFPSMDKAYASEFSLEFNYNDKDFSLEYKDDQLGLVSK
jgi:catechol-2,3-dioxygenase